MTRCKPFYKKVKEIRDDEVELTAFCRKEDSTIAEILRHIDFMDEYFPNWLDEQLSKDISLLNPSSTKKIRALTKYAPELVPEVIEEVAQLPSPTTMTISNIIKDKLRGSIHAPEPPEGEYEVIVIDPPWEGIRAEAYDPESGRGVPPYPTMSVDEIAALELPLAENAAVFLWTFGPYLHDSFHIFDAWDIEWKATLVWVKDYIKIGTIFRNQHELIQVGFKGTPDYRQTHQSTVIEAPVREHSRKPDAFYHAIEEMFPGTKLDMFARESREGWDTWGAEEDKFDELGPEELPSD